MGIALKSLEESRGSAVDSHRPGHRPSLRRAVLEVIEVIEVRPESVLDSSRITRVEKRVGPKLFLPLTVSGAHETERNMIQGLLG